MTGRIAQQTDRAEQGEVADLRLRLERERAARHLAERGQALGRVLRAPSDTPTLVHRAAAELGLALGADRCLVRVADGDRVGALMAEWTAPGVALLGAVMPPPRLAALLEAAAPAGEPVWCDDLARDGRLGDDGPRAAAALGASAYGAVPLRLIDRSGDRLAGWLVVHRADSRPWEERDRALASGFADDLVGAVLQAIAHQQERDTVTRLREIDLMKTQMVSTVSHELRTPLSSIRGHLELWADGHVGPLPEVLAGSLDVVRRNCLRLEGLVDNLLALSRADSDDGPDLPAPVDLASLVEQVERGLGPTLATRRLRVSAGPVPAVEGLLGRSDDLERVLANLLHNAVKFTPDGGTVSLTVHPGHREVELVVADTGIGIPEEEQARLFQRFFRASNAVGAEIQGTGLGLALVHTIVEQHGGRVELDSAAGAGTTVTVCLPLAVRRHPTARSA